jgi:DNA-binding HxlR family transcriptional regulator
MMQVILCTLPTVKRTARNVHCPVNVALETLGDSWSLLVVRDLVFYGKRTFGEFLASEERITTSVLADRLAMLVREGILTKSRSPDDRRKEYYALTDKGLALIPVLVELANWGVTYGPEVSPNPLWVSKAQTDPQGLRELIHKTLCAGGSIWHGPNSVIDRLERDSHPTSSPHPGQTGT